MPTNQELANEYASRGLSPASPYDIVNYDNKNRADMDEKKYVVAQWKDAKGKWCCATFDRWSNGHKVSVNRHGHDWHDYWWFAGIRENGVEKSGTERSPYAQSLDLSIEQVKKAGYKIIKEI